MSHSLAAAAADQAPHREATQVADEPPEDVWVTAPPPRPIDAPAGPTLAAYVLSSEAMAAPATAAQDALERVPGVQATRSGGGADLATISVRGASSAQTPVYLAGMRLNDDLTGTADLSALPLWMLDRIEVYRGHAPLEVAEMGLGGAILLQPRLPFGTRAAGGIGFGSFGHREARAALSIAGRTAGAALAFRHQSATGDFPFVNDAGTRFDDTDDTEQTRRNADHRSLDSWALGSVVREGAIMTTLVNVYSRDAGAPGLQVVGARRARSHTGRILAATSARLACGDGPVLTGGCEIRLDSGVLVTRYRLSDPLRELGAAQNTEVAAERLNHRFRLRQALGQTNDLTIDVTHEAQALRLDGDGTPLQRATRHRFRLASAISATPLESLQVNALGALECHHTRAAESVATPESAAGCDSLQAVGRLGARLELAEPLAIFANLGRYVRVPTLGELYGISAVVRGNEALEAENGLSGDVGMTLSDGGRDLSYWVQVAAFARLADALIAYRRSSLGVVRPYNTGSARVLGLELVGAAVLWRLLEAGISVTTLDPRDTASELVNDLIPLMSRLVVAPWLEVTSPSWSPLALDRATATLRLHHRASRVADPAGLIMLQAQTRIDVEAALHFANHFAWRGRASNLLDQRTVDLIGYPLPGRALYSFLEVSW